MKGGPAERGHPTAPHPTPPASDASRPREPVPLIGFGEVAHTRLRPRRNAFVYPTYFLMLPMRRLRESPSPELARNRAAALSFWDRDHGEGGPDALAWVENLLQAQGIADADGEIWLHTYPRVLGYTFKPVSFWYCHRADGRLRAVVAEVNNTFGERHAYLLDGLRYGQPCLADKVFHVSPFCAVRGHYCFVFQRRWIEGREHTVARIDYHDRPEGPALLHTRVGGELVPLDAASRRRALWTHPAMTLAVIARIHWQALRLWLRRTPFFRQPAPPATDVTVAAVASSPADPAQA